MRHPTDGTLRRLVDEPAFVAEADREHVAGCPVCLSNLATVREDAAVAGAAMHLEVATDVEEGWRRLSAAPARAVTSARSRRWHVALRSPVIAIVGVIALVTGASVAAATDWVQIFRAEQIAPVTVEEADLVDLPDLSAFGELEVTEKANVHKVSDAAAAAKATGLQVPVVSALPRGVTGEPTYRVGGKVSAVFTYSAAKAAQTAAAAGQTLLPPPEGLDGSQFRLVAGPGLMAVWSKGRGVPTLVVARAGTPTAYSTGVPFLTARDYLLSLPMLPKDIASQLRAFTGDGTTLPLVVSAERMTSSTTDIKGVPATVLTSRDGVMAGVVWVDGGVLTAVAGSLSADEVLSVARGLRWDR
ncbi:MAG TPA: hypothetical protein VF062_17315 [Candidatus Limnocylindrales bacterium]